MKLIILKNNLRSGLDIVGRAVGANLNLPILGNVLIKTIENKIKISATNLEIAITAFVQGKIVEDGSITVPFSVLANITSNIPNERIDIEVKNNNLILKTDNYNASIQGLPESDFPIIPEIKDGAESFEINNSILKNSINKVVIAAGTNDLRPELNSVYLIVEPSSLKLVSTDSFRLAEFTISGEQFKNNSERGVKIILPLKTAEALYKVIKDEDDKTKFTIENNQILIESGGVGIVSRLIEGRFPDHEAIIPKEINTEVLVSRKELLNALKLASSFTSRVKDIKIKIKDKKVIEIYSSDSSLGENNYLIPAKIKGENEEIVFNGKYLLDGAKSEDSDQIFLGLNGDNKPTLIKTPNNTSYFYILMPIKNS
ncbi:MAG TPA: DNA polymerase III subunit beta [Candidatus Paceibacterota bacterium]